MTKQMVAIIGGGPYGLSLASHLAARNIEQWPRQHAQHSPRDAFTTHVRLSVPAPERCSGDSLAASLRHSQSLSTDSLDWY